MDRLSGGGIKSAFRGRARAVSITRELNETDLTQAGALQIGASAPDYSFRTRATGRVGVRKGNRRLWRFCVEGNEFVSRTVQDDR